MAQKFIQFISPNTNINFIGKSRGVFMSSILLVIVSVSLLLTRGLNYGVDFTGGTEIHVKFAEKPSAGEVRKALAPIGFSNASVQGFGDTGSGEFLIRVETADIRIKEHQAQLENALKAAGLENPQLRFSEDRLYVKLTKLSSPEKIQTAINQANIPDLQVESVNIFGRESENEYLVRFFGVATQMTNALKQTFGKTKVEVLQIDQIGPKVGSELRWQAIGAVLISLIFILIYVWFRFDFEFAPGAIIALAHDSLLVLGIFSLLGLQFDLPIVAALLTIVGYSINDTIVLFDRVRENIRKHRDPSLPEVINHSINQTLSRTLLTSGTSMVAALSLLFLGGPITFNFALAFAIGIFVGTYSSIFIASPVTIYVHNFIQKNR